MPSQNDGVAMPSTAMAPDMRSMIVPRYTAARSAERDRDDDRADERQRHQCQRVGQPLQEDLDGGLAVADRRPEIAVQRAAEERDELLVDRAIEPERLQEVLAVVAGGVLGQEQIGRVAGHPRQREDDERQHDEHPEALRRPAGG